MSSKSGRIRAPSEKWFIGPPRVQTKNGISIGPAVIAQFMLVANKHKSRRQTDRETDRQTDRHTTLHDTSVTTGCVFTFCVRCGIEIAREFLITRFRVTSGQRNADDVTDDDGRARQIPINMCHVTLG